MSLKPDYELDFVKWVQKNKQKTDVIGKYMPRSWYGEYLQELLNHLLNQRDAVVKKDTVTSIRLTDDRKNEVKTETEEETVNCIHLATGHLAYQDPYK